MTNKHEELLKLFEDEIRAALDYLEYSHKKIQSLPIDPQQLDPETMETWESYVSRFARVTDIFLSKYIRTFMQMKDPGFRGEMRDFIDKSEKNNLISSSDKWMQIRELRNKVAHEYSRSDLKITFQDVKSYTPFVISELRRIFP